MAINSDIRDQAYQFFIEEAPELLHIIEAGLLTLNQERSPAKIHSLMRAAHSLKGGAASVGLDAIATLAHRLENIFKALYNDTLATETAVEDWLLQAYDCLRLPLIEQITTGSFNSEQVLAAAEPVFSQIEAHCGDTLLEAESYIPSSTDMGIDMVLSIFEVDVAQGLEQLAAAIADPHSDLLGELQMQVEMFAGFAELLNLSNFGAIAQTVQQALDLHPSRILEIAQLALTEFELSRQAVLAGDRTGTAASTALIRLATNELAVQAEIDVRTHLATDIEDIVEVIQTSEIAYSNQAGEFYQLTPVELVTNLSAGEETLEINLLVEEAAEDLEETLITTELIDYVEISDQSANFTEDTFFKDNTDFLETADPAEHRLYSFAATDQDNLISVAIPSNRPLPSGSASTVNLTVRVDADRLERMNNLVGELAINRSSLALQNDQLQKVLRELRGRFARFQTLISHLQGSSDRMLVAPELSTAIQQPTVPNRPHRHEPTSYTRIEFDDLEMDRYGLVHAQVQSVLENLIQLEESVEDIALFAQQSNQTLDQQQHQLTQLRDELVWARMLPLSEVLNRFPRTLRDLSVTYQKPVNLTLTGADVLIDRAILGKLYDPLLHLLRNAFDHGIESPEQRQAQGKPEQGQIEIRAFHQGNQTVIEVRDDGQGINLERISDRVLELGWLSAEQIATIIPAQLIELLFEPGFSTATQVSELSGRGFGLDVVRSKLQEIRGTVSVTSSGKGTTFTLSLPLTLTITQLILCLVGSLPVALPADGIEDILTPQSNQLHHVGTQPSLDWRGQTIPVYPLADLLQYACPAPEGAASQVLAAFPSPKDWATPVIVLRREQQIFALAVERIITEQELVVKPFGTTIAPPSYLYGCTILGDGSPVPVIDAATLLSFRANQPTSTLIAVDSESTLVTDRNLRSHSFNGTPTVNRAIQVPTILVVDDAITSRRTLALFLEREGFRVVQAQDGREAIDQFQYLTVQRSTVKLIVCDIEMPNMNGFEFLSHRRQDPQLAAVPAVILTSRSNDKHRWLAMQLGATAYFTKPYLEQEFLTALKALL